MIELYECNEEECDTLVTVNQQRWELIGSVFCRWHQKRQKQPPSPDEPISREVSHVSGRVGACFYCGFEENLTRDHIIPKSSGKQFRGPWNTVWACEFCNRKKADLQLAEWVQLVHGYMAQHVKYQRIAERSRKFITHLLTHPSHEGIRKHRARIDPWFQE